MLTELGQFLDDLAAQHEKPDLLVIATDANCKGLAKRSREILDGSPTPSIRTVIAIPDPHIERWLLLDGAAFKAVFGRGCQAPDQKCERDRYKNLLSNAIYEAGIDAALGGVENADAIVSNLNLERTAAADVSFGRFVHDLRQALQAIP